MEMSLLIYLIFWKNISKYFRKIYLSNIWEKIYLIVIGKLYVSNIVVNKSIYPIFGKSIYV